MRGSAPSPGDVSAAGTSCGRIADGLRNTDDAAAGLTVKATTSHSDISAAACGPPAEHSIPQYRLQRCRLRWFT